MHSKKNFIRTRRVFPLFPYFSEMESAVKISPTVIADPDEDHVLA